MGSEMNTTMNSSHYIRFDSNNIQLDDSQQQQEQPQQQQRYLKNTENSMINANASLYVDSQYSLYTGYQQAWRVLGFYVDCQQKSSDDNDDQTNVCTRYLLWASYVDLEYTGNGIMEYAFYNPTTNSYGGDGGTTSTCNVSSSSTSGTSTTTTRCAKMDCHDSRNTHWKLLGIYKQQYYGSEWLEQLLKHQGSCIYDSDTLQFMQTYYNQWPEGCINTNNNNGLYLDIKPSYGAYMTMGLYTDSTCQIEYDNDNDNNDYNTKLNNALSTLGYISASNLITWNTHFNTFKYCQPCTSYSPYNNGGYNKDNNNNQNNNNNNQNNYGSHSCTDMAGYTNINQCMKFRSKTTMLPVTIQELDVANQQGGMMEITIRGKTYGTPLTSISGTYQEQPYSYGSSSSSSSMNSNNKTPEDADPLWITSIVVLCIGLISFVSMIRWRMYREIQKVNKKQQQQQQQVTFLKEPLMEQ